MSIWHRRRLLDQAGGNEVAANLATNSLVFYHQLENSTTTVGPAMTETGSPSYPAGVIENGIETTSGKYLSIANANMGDLKVNGDFSVAFWMKTDRGASSFGDVPVAWLTSTGNQRSWFVNYEGTLDRMYFAVSANGSTSQPTQYAEAVVSSLYDGSHDADLWKFYVCRWYADTDTATVSVDNGAKSGSDSKTNSGIFQSTSDFYIGRQGGGTELLGHVDELGIWTRVLTAAEEAYLYNGGAGRTYPFE